MSTAFLSVTSVVSAGGRLRSIALPRGRRLRAGQVFHAIFLAIARDTELQVGIAQLCSSADLAVVKRFVACAANITLETLPPRGNVVAVLCLMKKIAPEKDQIICESGDHRSEECRVGKEC